MQSIIFSSTIISALTLDGFVLRFEKVAIPSALTYLLVQAEPCIKNLELL